MFLESIFSQIALKCTKYSYNLWKYRILLDLATKIGDSDLNLDPYIGLVPFWAIMVKNVLNILHGMHATSTHRLMNTFPQEFCQVAVVLPRNVVEQTICFTWKTFCVREQKGSNYQEGIYHRKSWRVLLTSPCTSSPSLCYKISEHCGYIISFWQGFQIVF